MKITSLVAAALAFALSAAQPANAATLYTPAAGFMNVPATCLAVNVGTKPIEVLIEQFNLFGALSNQTTETIAPGAGWAFNGGAGEAFYCKFTFKGSKGNLRGSVCFAGGGGCLSAQ